MFTPFDDVLYDLTALPSFLFPDLKPGSLLSESCQLAKLFMKRLNFTLETARGNRFFSLEFLNFFSLGKAACVNSSANFCCKPKW